MEAVSTLQLFLFGFWMSSPWWNLYGINPTGASPWKMLRDMGVPREVPGIILLILCVVFLFSCVSGRSWLKKRTLLFSSVVLLATSYTTILSNYESMASVSFWSIAIFHTALMIMEEPYDR